MRTRNLWGIGAIVAAPLLAFASPADAATFKVSFRGDPAPNACTPAHCSLREAVLRANNSSPGPDTVVLPNRRRPYQLRIENAAPIGEDGSLTGDLDVTNDPLTIKHRGKGVATVDGNDIDRVFHAFAPLTLMQIHVSDGNATADTTDDAGGGVLTFARLRILRSRLTDNRGDHGGAVSVQELASVKIARSRLAGNVDTDAGAGVYFSSAAPSSISRTQFVGNRTVNSSEAGAVSLFDTQLRISRSTFAGNSAQREGGAIVAQASELRIEDSTISGNRALAGGGGIYLFDGQTTVVNTTITRNRSTEDGGGIVVHGVGELALNAVTIARNLANSDDNPLSEGGGGLSNDSAGSVTVENSILALNRLGPGPRNDCTGNPIDSGGGNLLATLGPSGVCLGFDGTGNAVRNDPGLAKLSQNGGPTKTIALKAGSPAIGRAHASAPGRDQRGRKRDGQPDSGAYER